MRRNPLALCACLATASLLGGCGHLMPKEVRNMEERTAGVAARLEAAHPQFAHDLRSGDRTIHYVEIEDAHPKPLVLFIHGSPGSWQGWADYLADPDLQRQADLVAVDRPGFGGSGRGNAERSLEKQCEDIAPLLSLAKPGQRVVVVGHSYGGPVAARLAMDHPDKITDVILLAGSIDPSMEHTKWFQYPAEWKLFSWIVPTDLLVANREIRHLKADLTEMLPLWPDITQRVTVIQGENDDLVAAENADFAARHLTKAASLEMIRIPNQNHFLPWNQYSLVKGAILKHLQ